MKGNMMVIKKITSEAVPPQDLSTTKVDATADVPFELILQPKSLLTPASPVKGIPQDQAKLARGKTIEGAAKLFEPACLDIDSSGYLNNCAHYLSNAFIKADFVELTYPQDFIKHRCGLPNCSSGGNRPIQAIALKRWWKEEKNVTPRSSVDKGTGFYAVYQQRQSDGQEHVVILDSNTWKFYGTGWFEANQATELWKHEYYQW